MWPFKKKPKPEVAPPEPQVIPLKADANLKEMVDHASGFLKWCDLNKSYYMPMPVHDIWVSHDIDSENTHKISVHSNYSDYKYTCNFAMGTFPEISDEDEKAYMLMGASLYFADLNLDNKGAVKCSDLMEKS